MDSRLSATSSHQADRGFITSRGYRKATTRVLSARALSDSLLTWMIQRVHADEKFFLVYGIRKMWHAMNREGFHIGRDKSACLMNLPGVLEVGAVGGHAVITISSKVPDHRLVLVQWNFRAQASGRVWVVGITYVRPLSGFAYTAFVVVSRINWWWCHMLTDALGPWSKVSQLLDEFVGPS